MVFKNAFQKMMLSLLLILNVKKLQMKSIYSLQLFSILLLISFNSDAQSYIKGNLLYSNPLSVEKDTAGWSMEGEGKIEFNNNNMLMYSRNEKSHHVFWCPENFPENIIAEWEVQNLHTDAGLCIVFFAAKGLHDEDIFSSSLPERNGKFKNYTNGAINNYHISYYANGKDEPGRETANLRKNSGFHLVQSDQPGIPVHSADKHKIQLIKYYGHIQLFIDNRKVIDWQDDGRQFGKILKDGKIGFRQMKWTQFIYANFNVWECVIIK